MADKTINFPGTDGFIVPVKAVDQGDGTYALASTATIETGDIEIGAVEIKNATDDQRAVVDSDGNLSTDIPRLLIPDADKNKDMNAVAIGAIATVWTPAAGKKIRLMGGSFSVDAAVSVLFEDNAAGAGNFVWRTPVLAADTPYNFDMGNGKLLSAADNVLKATASGAANITGTLYGIEV